MQIILKKDKLKYLFDLGLKFNTVEIGEYFATIEIEEINRLTLLIFFRAGMLYSEEINK